MSHQLHNSLARILTADGIPVGVGFIASENLILTCAHVIEQASESDETAHFDLPLLAPGESLSGRVSFRDDKQDIATIEATGLPLDAAPVRLVQTEELWGHTFRAFGVPSGHDSGVWASGVLRDQNAQGWLHIEDTKTTGFAVQPGFSGGPVWDENLNAVVGMVVAAERDPSIKAAFCVPVEKLSEAVPDLKAQSIPPNPYRGLYAFREQDAPLFFGRESFSETLLETVSSSSLVAVVGASGAGKSSVVFAGLLPKLRPNAEWLIAEFRPGPRPFESLAATLLPLLEPEMSETDRLLEMRKLSGALKSGDLALVNIPPTLEEAELREIIARPARDLGLVFAPGLVDAILADARTADPSGRAIRSTVLPLLEFALTQLWERRVEGELTHEAYRAMDGVTGGLSQWADRAYYRLDKFTQTQIEFMLL